MRFTANNFNGREICLHISAENQAEEYQLTSLRERLSEAGCRIVNDDGISIFLHLTTQSTGQEGE